MDEYAEPADPPGVWRELDALVERLETARARIAAAQAEETSLLAEAIQIVEMRSAERRGRGVRVDNDLPLREVAAELGTAMRVSDRTVQRRMGDAHTLVTRFAATFDAWGRGEIERSHAAIIAEEGIVIVDATSRADYEHLVLDVARVESAGRLRQIARAIAARIDPESVEERMIAGREERHVRAYDLGDGMARLLTDLPAPLAFAIVDRLSRQAHIVLAAIDDSNADARTLDQTRADLLADILLTGSPSAYAGDERWAGLAAVRGNVQVTIPLATLAGAGDDPALLAGIGPVDPELVRILAGRASGWDRVFTDSATGVPVAVDRYRPSAELRRFLIARDEHCRFPVCRRPASGCDADHTLAAADGGPTSSDNLGAFCRRHHTLKHASPWTVEQLPGGHFRWTSPTGRLYDDRAPSAHRFVPPKMRAPVSFHDTDQLYRHGDPPPF